MGRRKIEIKAIKDDRNRSVTFLKRKGGLFKKAHELSVLCSVDVAVIIFGNNKKLYEYSSADMRDLIGRYQYHGGPNEHKGPLDFNGGNDDEEDEEGEVTPPEADPRTDPYQPHAMVPPVYDGPQAPFPHMRHETPSSSPPVHSGATFPGQPPNMGPRPRSRNDTQRPPHTMLPPQSNHQGMSYLPTPPMYNGPNTLAAPQHPAQYPYQAHHSQQHPQPSSHQQRQQSLPPPQQQQQQQQSQSQPYVEDRRASSVSLFPSPQPPSAPSVPRTNSTPPQPGLQHAPRAVQISPPPPPSRAQDASQPGPVPKKERRAGSVGDAPDRPQPPLLNTDSTVRRGRKAQSIFTPIEESRSILSQHLASFANQSPVAKAERESAPPAALMAPNHLSSDSAGAGADRAAPLQARQDVGPYTAKTTDRPGSRKPSTSEAPEAAFPPPTRTNSLKSSTGATRLRGPRLTVQIPDGASESGSAAGGSSNSPKPTESSTPSHSSRVVLPPPSPSASAILSAGATGPPNPFARPPPQQSINGETPASALPSRFLNSEYLPSPSNFYHDWGFGRSGDSNTLPSPLNFATPVVGSGPSFLREEPSLSTPATSLGSTASAPSATAGGGVPKRKSPDVPESASAIQEPKRVKVSP